MPQWGAPILLVVLHLTVVGVCACYDPEVIHVWRLRGFFSVALLISALAALYRCVAVDPGYLVSHSSSPHLPDDTDVEHNRTHNNPGTLTLPLPARREYELASFDDHEDQSPSSLRHCHVCDVTQPLRSKHCTDCNRCVRTFDHHCPWIGTCIGENNRSRFLVYLTAEAVTIAWFFLNGASRIHAHAGQPEKVGPLAFLILAMIVMSIFFLMTAVLSCYHSFLAIANLTTWEHSSWARISYLQELKKSRGSPFSAPTLLGNCFIYWRRPEPQGIGWIMGPQHQPFPAFFNDLCCDC